MKPCPTVRRSSVLRNICAVAALLGAGLVAGAMLAETSVMNFSLARPSTLLPHTGGYANDVNGYLTPADSRGQSRRPVSQPRGLTAHHMGL